MQWKMGIIFGPSDDYIHYSMEMGMLIIT